MFHAALDYESFFYAIMATIPSSIVVVDERLAIVSVNHNFLEKSRGSLESVLGRRLSEIFPAAFTLDLQITQVIATRTTLSRQRMTYRGPGVPLRVYSYSICPLQLRKGEHGAILLMDDVTDLLQLAEEVRRMQLHLASVVESAGDLIISTDPDGAVTTWNAAAEKATGYSSREVHGTNLADHIDELRKSEIEASFRGIADIDDQRSMEWPMRRRDGECIPVSWRLSRMTDPAGDVIGVVVVGRSLVEQRALEAQVQQGEKLAALGMVIGGIAHEIRNPLGVSSAAAQLMKNRISNPVLLGECIEKVIAGVDRASLVVESLLRFARPGRIADTTTVDVRDVLKNALMFASGEAVAGVAVEWKLPPESESLDAEGVQNLLELVVVNLMLNAFQAMPQGGRLTIAARHEEGEILVEIGDTGAGIPEAHLSRIFDPFFTTKSDSRRAGLGLSVSHSIIRQHGGSLVPRTAPHEGATFVLRIPAAQRRVSDHAVPGESP